MPFREIIGTYYEINNEHINIFEYMNVILIHSNQRHVAAIHVSVFRMVRRIQMQLWCRNKFTF
jgi:hypothetical protein